MNDPEVPQNQVEYEEPVGHLEPEIPLPEIRNKNNSRPALSDTIGK